MKDLLSLVNEFPQAFVNPESDSRFGDGLEIMPQTQASHSTGDKTQRLLQLIAEFPQAFADPEAPCVQLEEPSMPLESAAPAIPESVGVSDRTPLLGYAHALHRRLQTLTWGQVDFHLAYGASGLEEIWLIVGKSGTEIQSLGEAICRLINLLLSSGVPIPKIVREIRGIRGADSEGLGPNRILGLADLIGKVLQEAPTQYGTAQMPESLAESRAIDNTSNLPEVESVLISTPQPTGLAASAVPSQSQADQTSLYEVLSNTAAEASMLCPECGAELHQVNGCKGGACVVCGYSSCS